MKSKQTSNANINPMPPQTSLDKLKLFYEHIDTDRKAVSKSNK